MIESIYNAGYSIWNYLIGIAVTLFTVSPKTANGSVYSTAHDLYNAISSISLPIAIVFFLIAIFRDVVTTSPDQQARRFLSSAIKFGIMVGILANLWSVMGYIIQISDGITDTFSTTSGETSYELSVSSDLTDVIDEAATKPDVSISITSLGSDIKELLSQWFDYLMTNFLFLSVSLITLISIVASCVSIISSAFQRIIKPLVILPFSSIAVAMGSGTGEASRVMTSYLKSFFGFCISGAFMVICVKIGVSLADGMIAFDMDSLTTHEKVIFISIQNAIIPIIIAGLIKSADSVISRFF